MNKEKKKIPSFKIELHLDKGSGKPQKMVISPEKEGEQWHREEFDRKKDGLLIPEIIADMNKIAINLSKINESGQLIGKYANIFITNLPANPKSSKASRKKYSSYIKRYIKKKGWGKEIAKFHNKRVLVYIAIYLRRTRYEIGNDGDNFAKPILDSLEEYMGNDCRVVTLIVEKKLLSGYCDEDLDFLEQAIIAIADPEAKVDILKNVQK